MARLMKSHFCFIVPPIDGFLSMTVSSERDGAEIMLVKSSSSSLAGWAVELDGRLGTIITLVVGRGNESSGLRFRTRCQLHSNLHN